jgi:hypothetical protein
VADHPATRPRGPCRSGRSGYLVGQSRLREAMASSMKALRIGGEGRVAEIDGAYFIMAAKPTTAFDHKSGKFVIDSKFFTELGHEGL